MAGAAATRPATKARMTTEYFIVKDCIKKRKTRTKMNTQNERSEFVHSTSQRAQKENIARC